MSKEYKYDVAISFAEEDRKIAKEISKSLENFGLKPYFYKDEVAENWGENLFNIIIKRYQEESRFALILISEHYVKKKWADIERQIIQTVALRENSAYLLPLAIDDTKVDGITDNVLTVKWKKNPEKIAEMVKEKVEKRIELFNEKENEEDQISGVTVKNFNSKIKTQINAGEIKNLKIK